jgi:hypothetical protein
MVDGAKVKKLSAIKSPLRYHPSEKYEKFISSFNILSFFLGYSSIISQPMEFSTMRTKLPEYDSLAVFRTDFELICRNAMTYNTVDTIYYKSADKLIRYGQKFFSVEKLRSMKTHLAFASIIPDECLGRLSFYNFYYNQAYDKLPICVFSTSFPWSNLNASF